MLDELVLQGLIEEFAPRCAALALSGSYARGTASATSDVDLHLYGDTLPEDEPEYRMEIRGGLPVSISYVTFAAREKQMKTPQDAILAVPGLRQLRILRDPSGRLAALCERARKFRWDTLQESANRWVSAELAGYAEEVGKVIGALGRGDSSAAAYGTLGLVIGLAKAVSVQRGILLESENQFFSAPLEALGENAAWSRALRTVAGLGEEAANPPYLRMRALAALDLYAETARLFENIVLPAHRPVVDWALQRIQMYQLK